MQISSNTTGMEAGLYVSTDKDARDHCVVVVKGSFVAGVDGQMHLAEQQRPLLSVEEHYGEPEATSVRYECDFTPPKPSVDVVVVGKAVVPEGRAARELLVRLEVQGVVKDALVTGERRWIRAPGGLVASDAVPFKEMPLTFERAYGGCDDSLGEQRVAVEPRNMAGVGFHAHRSASKIEGFALPNVEDPVQRIRSPRDTPSPIGFGFIARNHPARLRHAGTYDEAWLNDQFPFLPADFDARFFQSAPEDQRFTRFVGGERIRCIHMAEAGLVQYILPSSCLPVRFNFEDRSVEHHASLDTVTLEPHIRHAMLTWRASAPLGKKLTLLNDVLVGDQSAAPDGLLGYRGGKPMFNGLDAAIRFQRGGRGGR